MHTSAGRRISIGPLPPAPLKRPEYHDDLDGGIDYYEVLGIVETSTPEEILSAFRVRIREVHPDLGGDHDAAARLLRARRVLTGDERGDYDAVRSAKVREAHERYLRADAARREADERVARAQRNAAESRRPPAPRTPPPQPRAWPPTPAVTPRYAPRVPPASRRGVLDFKDWDGPFASPVGLDNAALEVEAIRHLDHRDGEAALRTASRIISIDASDRAFAAVGFHAAKRGMAETASTATSRIISIELQDRALEDAAVALASAGKGQEAIHMASRIINLVGEDRAFASIALALGKRGRREEARIAVGRIINYQLSEQVRHQLGLDGYY